MPELHGSESAKAMQDEDMLLVKVPSALRGQIMLEAMRAKFQRTAYLAEFAGSHAAGLCQCHHVHVSSYA